MTVDTDNQLKTPKSSTTSSKYRRTKNGYNAKRDLRRLLNLSWKSTDDNVAVLIIGKPNPSRNHNLAHFSHGKALAGPQRTESRVININLIDFHVEDTLKKGSFNAKIRSLNTASTQFRKSP